MDLAEAHVKALDILEASKCGFVCNLGTGKGSSVLEVVAAFEQATGIQIPYEFTGRRDGDVTEAWADPSYAKKNSRLGIKIRPDRHVERCLAMAE